jgi:hypothetical protein
MRRHRGFQAQLRSQIDVTQKILGVQEKELEITEKRYAAGGVSLADVQNQTTEIAQLGAELPPLEQELDTIFAVDWFEGPSVSPQHVKVERIGKPLPKLPVAAGRVLHSRFGLSSLTAPSLRGQ